MSAMVTVFAGTGIALLAKSRDCELNGVERSQNATTPGVVFNCLSYDRDTLMWADSKPGLTEEAHFF